jgi:flagellar hook-length control protein FliK
MELLTSLPADLTAIVDPSARGAAQLLKVADPDGAAPEAATPFALCLALLTTPVPGGEAWPAAGKDLPVVSLEPVTETLPATPSDALLTLAPIALDASLQPWPGAVQELASGELTAAASAVPLADAKPAWAALPPLPGDAPGTVAAPFAAPAAADLGALTALAAADVAPAPLAAAEQHAAQLPAETTAAPSWLETFADERRLQRPPAPSLDARAAGAPTAGAAVTANVQSHASIAAAASSFELSGAMRRIDLSKTIAPVAAADAAGIVQSDWLAPAAGHNGSTGAVAASAPSAGTPVDLRSPTGQETFANRVQWLVDQNVGEAHIKLNPPELGLVDVKISLVDDKTYVQLTTATAAARDELAQSLPRLRELLSVSGLELGGASVHNGRDGHAAHGHHGGTGSADSDGLPRFAGADDEPVAFVPRRSLGRIDVFA